MAQTQGPKGDPGAPGLIYIGPYNAATSYSATDVVTYGGSAWVAVANSTGVTPGTASSTASWNVLAQAGAAGAAGPQGPQGVPGLPGIQGVAGVQGLAGPAGPVGAAGATGATGAQGSPGLTGAAGPVGLSGPAGPTGPTGPAGAQGVAGTGFVSPVQGRRMSVLGDSISALFANAWQNVVLQRTGMVLVSQDARASRSYRQAFECYGQTNPGFALGVFDPTVISGSGQPCSKVTTGLTAGSTLAQNMSNVDLLVIDLGTNDQYTTSLGSPGDAVSVGSYWGNMRWVVETYEAANPAMRIILIAPETGYGVAGSLQQFADATVAYGKSAGIPVIDMRALGGVNALTLSTLTRDGIHPSDLGFSHFYGPVIAQGILNVE